MRSFGHTPLLFLALALPGLLVGCGGDVFFVSPLTDPDGGVLVPDDDPEPSPQPDAEPDQEPSAAPDPEPADEPDPEPADEPDPEPAADPDPEPAPEPDAQPDPEPTPDPEPEPTTPACYDEPIFPDEPIDDLVQTYGGNNWKDELIGIMDRRHPATGFLLDEMRNDSYFGQFSDPWSWTGMVGWLDTLSHEETHLFNAYHAIDVGAHAAITLREDLIFYLPSTNTPARSLVLGELAPDVADGIYAPTYLTGWQGDRGFNELLDETNAYLNEIGAVGVVGEHFPGFGVSLRDGAPALMHFTQVYLQKLRADQPAAWQALHDVEVYRDVVLYLWLRLHFLLPVADAFDNLGINDQMYRDAMHAPALIDEIALFTDRDLDADACVYDGDPLPY